MEGNVFMEQWNEYLEALASRHRLRGRSAAAVYGAIGTTLGEMVGNLTSGKKSLRYMRRCPEDPCETWRGEWIFIRREADEQAFQPLSEVYRMKAETKEEDGKEERMEEC